MCALIINVREGNQSPARWKHLSTAVLLVHGAERLPVLLWPTTLASLTLPPNLSPNNPVLSVLQQGVGTMTKGWHCNTQSKSSFGEIRVRTECGMAKPGPPPSSAFPSYGCHSQLTPVSISSPSPGRAGVLNVCWCNLPSLLSSLLSINPICPERWQILKCTLLRNQSKSETQ